MEDEVTPTSNVMLTAQLLPPLPQSQECLESVFLKCHAVNTMSRIHCRAISAKRLHAGKIYDHHCQSRYSFASKKMFVRHCIENDNVMSVYAEYVLVIPQPETKEFL